MVIYKFKHGYQTSIPISGCQAFNPPILSKLGRVEVIYPYRDITSPTVMRLVNFRVKINKEER